MIMRKIVLAFMFVIVLCGISSADVAYTTTDGKLGLITIQGSKSADLKGIQYDTGKENPIVGAYWDKGESKLLVITSEEESYDHAVRFSPSNSLNAIDSQPKILTGVNNATRILSASSGNGVLFVYGSTVQEFHTDNLESTDRFYTYSDDVEIKDALVIGIGVYVLVDDYLLLFDGQLKEGTKNYTQWALAEGSETMSYISGTKIAIGNKTGIQVLGSTLIDLLVTNIPVKTICADNSSGFYYVTQDISGDVYQNVLCHYTGATTNEILKFNGERVKVLRDSSHNVLAAIVDGNIQLYDMADDTLIAEYDAATLGGEPFELAKSTSSGDTPKNGGSCNISGVGAFLLLMSIFCFVIIHNNHYSILESR